MQIFFSTFVLVLVVVLVFGKRKKIEDKEEYEYENERITKARSEVPSIAASQSFFPCAKLRAVRRAETEEILFLNLWLTLLRLRRAESKAVCFLSRCDARSPFDL